MFSNCSSLQTLDVSNWNTSNVTNMNYMFSLCRSLQTLDVSGWNTSNVTNIASMFGACRSLQTLIGGRTIEEVISNNISALNGLKISISLSNTNLDRASLRAIINGLADLTGSSAKQLPLGSTLKAKLTEEDIAVATAKNWTIA
jgi:surface protein